MDERVEAITDDEIQIQDPTGTAATEELAASTEDDAWDGIE